MSDFHARHFSDSWLYDGEAYCLYVTALSSLRRKEGIYLFTTATDVVGRVGLDTAGKDLRPVPKAAVHNE